MRTIQCLGATGLVAAVGASVLIAGAARAEIATERPGSILMFPKVVRDGQRDTRIQITNTSTMVNNVRCFYLDGAPGPDGRPVWTVRDFELVLTRRQPTQWLAGKGRRVDPFDPFGSDSAGLDPGLVPSVPEGFTGALVCVEVGADGLPVGLNGLKGEATIEGPVVNQSKYNALALDAGASVSGNTLDLNGTEYAACPAASWLNFIPDGAVDPVIEALGNGGVCVGGDNPGSPCNNSGQCLGGTCSAGRSNVVTNLTVLPCNMDFQNGFPSGVSLNFEVRDEFEVLFTGSTNVDCWATFSIGAIPAMRSSLLTGGAITTQYATVRISSLPGEPFVAIAESFHTDSIGNRATAANNLHLEGADPGARIVLSDP